MLSKVTSALPSEGDVSDCTVRDFENALLDVSQANLGECL